MGSAQDVIIDDDGTGEVADLVCLRAIDGTLVVHFVHCKYSSESNPGARLADLFEVLGQAQRSAAWRRDVDGLFARLIRRERTRAKAGRPSGMVRGTIEELHTLFEQSPNLLTRLQITVAQPGLSATAVKDRHLELLASADTFIADTAQSLLGVWCSP